VLRCACGVGYVRNTTLVQNEFVRTGKLHVCHLRHRGAPGPLESAGCLLLILAPASGDHGVVALGQVELIDGTGETHVANTTVAFNLAHEIGIFGKQSCFGSKGTPKEPPSMAISPTTVASSAVERRRAPSAGARERRTARAAGARALIDFNDGAYGGNEMMHNLLFNAVRETGTQAPQGPVWRPTNGARATQGYISVCVCVRVRGVV
jgi:hypothetical protein